MNDSDEEFKRFTSTTYYFVLSLDNANTLPSYQYRKESIRGISPFKDLRQHISKFAEYMSGNRNLRLFINKHFCKR